jgi:hypothetical protein
LFINIESNAKGHVLFSLSLRERVRVRGLSASHN